MKYSLRSLMIVVTLACLVIGGRMEHLRRRASFHETEENRILSELSSSANDSPAVPVEVLRQRLASLAMEQHQLKIVPGFICPRLVANGEIVSLWDQNDLDLWVSAIHEKQLRDAYTLALSRPWMPVTEPSPLPVIRR